ncbi:MAG: hypothetical protein KatS3mg087_1321 [Patescibacteria group bacterium]|nr:MAG: hypothetical protein KatS3mg087_1321 [Patescibacteria group bacterium]
MKKIIIQNSNELERYTPFPKILYLDIETHSEAKIISPWFGHKLAGLALGIEDAVLYIPIRHVNYPNNLDFVTVINFLQKHLQDVSILVGHNIKFDLIVLMLEGLTLPDSIYIYDTEIAARHYNDSLAAYRLESLCRNLLSYDLPEVESIKLSSFLKEEKQSSYAYYPVTKMINYVYGDITGTKKLHEFFNANLDTTIALKIDMEFNKLMLFAEYHGVQVFKEECKAAQYLAYQELITAQSRINQILGEDFNPKSYMQCKYLFEIILELPVVKWNEKNDPPTASYDSEALGLYLTLPQVQENKEVYELIQNIKKCRDLDQLISLTLNNFIRYNVNDKIHSTTHPCIARGGRSSMQKPSLHQVPKFARKLIRPMPGNVFIARDYSQIEYRWFVHYAKNDHLTNLYKENPDTDIHSAIAEWLNVERSVAKTLNFGLLYRMGTEKLERKLRLASPNKINKPLAQKIWLSYHEKVPTIKTIQRLMEDKARLKGYVTNWYGKKSYLTRRDSYKAMNRIIQGSAAYYAKSRTLIVDKLLREKLKLSQTTRILIHDELVLEVPKEAAAEASKIVKEGMELLDGQTVCPSILEGERTCRVPIRSNGGWSEISLADAEKDS